MVIEYQSSDLYLPYSAVPLSFCKQPILSVGEYWESAMLFASGAWVSEDTIEGEGTKCQKGKNWGHCGGLNRT